VRRNAARIVIALAALAGSLSAPALALALDLGSPLRGGDVVVRRGAQLSVYRPGAGAKPVARVALRLVGSKADHFAGGLAVSPRGDLFVPVKPKTNQIEMVPAGRARSRSVVTFPERSRDWHYVTAALAPTNASLLVVTTGGVLHRYARRGGEFEKTGERNVVGVEVHGGTLVDLPSDDHVLLTVNCADPAGNVFVIRVSDMRVVSTLGDELAIFARPSAAVFVPVSRPFLAVSSGRLRGDGSKNAHHLVALGWDDAIKALTPPVKANRPDGMACSLVTNSNEKNGWLAQFGACAYDTAQRRVLVSSNTPRGGRSLYAVPADRLARGGLTMADLTPLFERGGRNVVVVPAHD